MGASGVSRCAPPAGVKQKNPKSSKQAVPRVRNAGVSVRRILRAEVQTS
jgi:ribosomal protein S30